MKNENILNGSKTETMDSDFANELIKEWIYWLSYVSEEDKAKLEEFARIPSREGLYTMLAGGMIGIVKDLSIALNLLAEQKEN